MLSLRNRIKGYMFITAILLFLLQSNVYAAGTISSIKINEQLPATGSTKLTVTGTYSDGTSAIISTGVVWTSTNIDVAVVDSNGNVAFTGRGGAVTITATYQGIVNSVSVSTQFVPAASSYITMNGIPYYCEKGSLYPLTVQSVFSDNSVEIMNNKYVTFTCSNNNIATVNADGVVSVHGDVGAFMITATYRDKSAMLISVINSANWVPSTGWIPTQYTTEGVITGIKIYGDIPNGPFQARKLEAKGEYTDGYSRPLPNATSWTTSDAEIVNISSDGTIYFGGKYGEVTITAKYGQYVDSLKIYIDNSQQIYEENRRIIEADTLMYNKQKSYFDEKVVDADNIITTIEQLVTANQKTNIAKFKDIKNHWSEKEINIASELGIISGYSDNTFKPDNRISRAEFAAMIYKAFSVRYYIDDPNKTFKDVKGLWHQDYVMALKNTGVINGYVDGTFKPNNYITRSEMIAIISRLIVKEDIVKRDSTEKYSDSDDNYWAKKDIDKLYSIGALEMIGKSKLEPNKSATRAEVVNIIVRLLMNIDKNSK
ncbi:MAG: S-layer domain protein [Clostridia bacterium]|jgi:hypothetical protein|nr:S-layer domain protein [Clostridia bacterium]